MVVRVCFHKNCGLGTGVRRFFTGSALGVLKQKMDSTTVEWEQQQSKGEEILDSKKPTQI